MFFAFDVSRNSLVYFNETTKQPGMLSVKQLEGFGWKNCSAAALRSVLPRADKSAIDLSADPRFMRKR